jgi:nitrogen fixation NifU-like protein
MSASDLEELYRDILLDHYRSPRNKGHIPGEASCAADGANPLCGDQIRIELNVDGGRIEDIAFDGNGCSISQASASMMTEYVKGRSIEEAHDGVRAFQRMMVEGEPLGEEYGDIEALVGVAKFPVRVKCASLAWKTLEQALSEGAPRVPVTTDERSQ